MSTCVLCGKEIKGEVKKITFEYEGLEFTIQKDSMSCRNCAKENYIEFFERVGSDLVDKEDGELKVNWKNLTKSPSLCNDKIEILIALDVLSLEEEGNWKLDLFRGKLISYPNYAPWEYHFTKKKYVESYIKTKLVNSPHFFKVLHIDKVISKDEILK